MIIAWMVFALATAARRAWGKCPAKLGVAINTGDNREEMRRVQYALGADGWARKAQFDANGIEADVVVYSSVKRGWLPWGSTTPTHVAERCVPVVPCCGGRDLGKNLATAQKMREFTWKSMWNGFSEDTEWFISTEDDTWWNVTRLCAAHTCLPPSE